jgi:hypothetical protein
MPQVKQFRRVKGKGIDQNPKVIFLISKGALICEFEGFDITHS